MGRSPSALGSEGIVHTPKAALQAARWICVQKRGDTTFHRRSNAQRLQTISDPAARACRVFFLARRVPSTSTSTSTSTSSSSSSSSSGSSSSSSRSSGNNIGGGRRHKNNCGRSSNGDRINC